jgi:hypothetical protein
MSTNPSYGYVDHSATLRLNLHIAGQAYPLVKMGEKMCVLREPCDIAAGDGELILEIDGSERRWPIHLPNPVVAPTTRIEFVDR